MNGTIATVLRDAKIKIDDLDKLCCARLKRTVKVEGEMRTMAREIESGSLRLLSMPKLKKQLHTWAVMLGVPE